MSWNRERLTRYPGNYTHYREQKRKNYEIQMKSYLRQQEEIERQEELIKRFKNKPSKAAFRPFQKEDIRTDASGGKAKGGYGPYFYRDDHSAGIQEVSGSLKQSI